MSGPTTLNPKEDPVYVIPDWTMNENIVVSGMAGRFPESESVEQFKQNLYNHVDMVTEDDRRWKRGLFGTPKGGGKLLDLEHFDAWFFGVHGKMVATMDPSQRILLEVVYEALFDAGIDPMSLSGRRVGVFVGSSGAFVPDVQSELDDLYTGYEAMGNSPAMMSNRVSYTFDFRGPSFTLDTGCSSSTYAINCAMMAMKSGQCDAAVVAGCTLLSFYHTAQLNNTKALSVDSRCKTYDKDANGFVRSEAISAIYLEKASEAKRCYATILNCRTNNDGRKIQGIMFPSAPLQMKLIQEAYDEIKMDPRSISFLEAHGTGNMTGDREEGRCIGDVFCPGKNDRMLVTSVKSNIGHTEATSGIASLIKVILSCENELIPANLHFKEPNPNVKALMEGRMIIPATNVPFKGGIIGISNFGFGGGNAHMIVKSHDVLRQAPTKPRAYPRLVTACGCTDQAVKFIFNTVREKEFTDEGIVLLEDACKTTPEKMRYRGYTLYGKDEPQNDVIQLCNAEPRPLWFLYSGMGSQWSKMGKDMMKLEPFAKSIRESAEVLKPFGVDLIHLLTEATDDDLNHIVFPFVTIAAVQIALTDILRSLGIKPAGIVGHSVGELGCAYADGTFTSKQMLLAAYWRGRSCVLSQLIEGKMAAVGMTWEDAKKRCPTGIFAVCHNAQDSVTISGPSAQMEEFLQVLKSENVFARAVKTGDIAFHCKYVEPASVIMRKELEKVIPNPVARSDRWVSSSVPEEKWDQSWAKLSSVDYHINNLLSPVLFSEAMTKVPKDAVIIEIAPHSLLQPIVKRIMGTKSTYVGLCNKTKPDNLRHFLNAIGSLYNNGLNPDIKNLYDPITFPVPRGTPMLNSLIQWDRTHWNTWSLTKSVHLRDQFTMDTIKGGPYEFVLGHKVDGRIMFTAPGYLWLAWKALARSILIDMEDLPVTFEDVKLHRAAVLPKSGVFIFNVKVRESDGTFNILEAGSIVASGKIRRLERGEFVPSTDEVSSQKEDNHEDDVITIDAKSFYKELHLRGYEYDRSFQGVTKTSSNGLKSTVKWTGNWITFIESMFQIALMHQPGRDLTLITNIRKATIDPYRTPENIGDELQVTYNSYINRLTTSVVEVQGLDLVLAPRRHLKQNKPAMEEQMFLPFMDKCAITDDDQRAMEEYSQVCSVIATRALKAMDKKIADSPMFKAQDQVTNSTVDKYLREENPRHVLLRTLHKAEITKKVPHVDMYELNKDLINVTCVSERSMRACVDCFLMNSNATKFNIVEISNHSIIYPEIDRYLKFTYYGYLTTNYQLFRINKDAVPSGLNPTANVYQLGPEDTPSPESSDLVVAKDIFTSSPLPTDQTLKTIHKSLKDNGFLILSERTAFTAAEKCANQILGVNLVAQKEEDLEKAFRICGLVMVAKKQDGQTFVTYLLRKVNEMTTKRQQVFRILEDKTFGWIEDLKVIFQQEEESNTDETLWLVDDRPDSGIVGLVTGLMKEFGGKRLRMYYNACLDKDQKAPRFDLSSPETQEVLKKDLRMNCFRDGQWGMFTNQVIRKELPYQLSKNCHLQQTERGDLTSLRWINSSFEPSYSDDLVSAHVAFSGINFQDVLACIGKIPPVVDKGTGGKMGLEFSGIEKDTGRRVMGLTPSRGLSNSVKCHRSLTFDVPAEWSLEDACTVPLAYLTAYYTLVDKATLETNETVLVHSGAGGIGQAAIAVALSRGCKVFATVGSEEKKEYLLKRFPALNQNQVINYKTSDIEEQVMIQTSRKGVHVVLNSSPDTLQLSCRCLKSNGRLLDLGTRGNSVIGMSDTFKSGNYYAIDMRTTLRTKNLRKLTSALDMVREGVSKGVVTPLSRTVFTWEQATEAFQYMESGSNVGKVLIKICEESSLSVKTPACLMAKPQLHFSPHKSVVVTGGLGGMGFELVLWLLGRGITKVVISSRSGIKDDYQRFWMNKWKRAGLQVKLCHEEISTYAGCRALLAMAARLGPVGAIFHLAVELRDGLLENSSADDYRSVCNGKLEGLRQLDSCSKDDCPELEYFFAASSLLTSKPVPGLGNYCYANSATERICELRQKRGLPGLAVQWGVIGDSGIFINEFGQDSCRHIDLRGSVLLNMSTCFVVLERYMLENKPIMSYFARPDESEFIETSRKDLLALMGNILGLSDLATLRGDTTIGGLGMDSLMVVEARQLLDTDYNVSLSIPQVLKLSIQDLKNISDGDKA